VSDYYKPRWILFFETLEESLIFGFPFDKTKFRQEFLEKIGTPFTKERKIYPTVPEGNPAEIATVLHRKYRPLPEVILC
jgi:alpha-N-acetylglucosaminidase